MNNFPELVTWWHDSLEASASPRTRKLYRDASDGLLDWMRETGKPLDEVPDRRLLDAYFSYFRTRPNMRTLQPLKPSYVQQHWRSLQQLFKFLTTEEMIDRNPYATMEKLPIPDSPVDIFTDDELHAFMKVTEGKDPRQRRDRAILRLLLDTGIRVGELCGLTLDDVNFQQKHISVTGKGSNEREVPFNTKANGDLRRWIMVRPKIVPNALFTDLRGRGNGLTTSGVRQLLNDRAEEAGVSNPYPHRFRHTAAHLWLVNGGQETDLQRIMGWSSGQMVARYAKSAGVSRAKLAAQRMAIGDRY